MNTPKPTRLSNDKPGNATRERIRNVLGQASVANGALGKLQPQAVDLEEAVLGALMLEKDALTTVIEILQIESFYKESHQKIYEAILQLFDNSEPVDILTVTNQLRKNGTLEFAGGSFYISGLTQRVNSAANVEYHARIVSEMAIKRELISIASEIEKEAYEDTTDTFALLDKTEQRIFNVSEVNIRKNYSDMRSMMREAIMELEAKKHHKDGLTGVPTGFTALDRLTSGWQKSDLVIIAARPAMGKTAFILTALRNAAVNFNHSVAIFSLEMSSIQLVNRLISAEAELESEKIKKGKLADYEWEQLYAKTAQLTEAQIFIDDTPALSIRELRSKCRRLKAQNDIQLIVIDYLQLMSGDSSKGGGNREQEIAAISRALKNIAKELDVPVIALSQLSRAVETRGGDKRPQLSDLRESGCLTGDALVFNAVTGEQVPIAELVQRQEAGTLDRFSTSAVDAQWRLNNHQVSNAFYSGKKEVFALTTRSGRTIKASGNHPFLKLDGWKYLDELQVGNKIAVPRSLSVSAPTNPITEDELILLAHLLGDGCILPRQPYHYTSADPANITVVRETAQWLFGIEGKIVQQGNWQHCYLPCPYRLTHGKKHPITQWYESLDLSRVRSYKKKIPSAVFQCDSDRIALFLHHLWATDGNISSSQSSRSKREVISVYYASSSRQLAQQVQHLLLRLGILSTVREQTSQKYRSMFHVQVYGREEQLKFLQQVGCYGQGGVKIPYYIEMLEQTESNPNTDIIPKEAWEAYVSQYKMMANISWRQFAQATNTQYCGSALFKRGISRMRMEQIYQVLPFATLKNLADSDVLWDEIVSIESLGVQDVYDITVDEAHNFVANDIITHNSIEQDADMVIFLYRPEYYGLTEDSEGQPTQGIGEIIISKHRNGALDTVQLKFIGKYTKFTNLDEVDTGATYGSSLMSAEMGSEFNDPNVVTFASKANNPRFNQEEDNKREEDNDDPPF